MAFDLTATTIHVRQFLQAAASSSGSSDLPAPLHGQRLAILIVRAAHAMSSQVSLALLAEADASADSPTPMSTHSAAADKAAAAGVAVVAAAAVRQTAPQLSDVLDAVLAALPELPPQPSQWQSSPLRATSAPFSPTPPGGNAAFQSAGPMPVPRSLASPLHPGTYGLPASPFGPNPPGANAASLL